jgi:hypothetical protein
MRIKKSTGRVHLSLEERKEIRNAKRRLKRLFEKILKSGGKMIFISGNH